MRLIDADVLKHNVISWLSPVVDEAKMVDADDIAVYVIMEIEEAPTIEPVKHGHWEQRDKKEIYNCTFAYVCSNCQFGDYMKARYCSNCGAKMDEKVDRLRKL